MLDSNRAIYLDHSPLGPGWYACEIEGNRILYTGPMRSREEALNERKKINPQGAEDRQEGSEKTKKTKNKKCPKCGETSVCPLGLGFAVCQRTWELAQYEAECADKGVKPEANDEPSFL